MSRVEVPMPQMGESIAEGTVSVWLKKVGDRVERDEPIMEISTDKVDAEIPSPAAGVLDEILVVAGETVEVGTVVGYINTEVGAVLQVAHPNGEGGQRVPEQGVAGVAGAGNGAGAGSGPVEPSENLADADSGALPTENGGSPSETEDDRLRLYSTPLVRRIAEENGIHLKDVHGTGRAGRVTKNDILGYIAERDRLVADGGLESTPKRLRTEGSEGAEAGTRGLSWDEFYTHVEHPEVEAGPKDRVEPMSRMTSLIAEHMVLSQRISAHVHSYFEIDYTRVDQIRERDRALWEEQGVKVTYTAFITQAAALALREHPRINAAISGQKVIYRGEINIGIAVATESGLIVPVIRNADSLSLVGISRAIADFASRARAKRLSPEEVLGGTFTITNPGIFGSMIGFPIVNQPQAAIMAVGAIDKRPAVIQDEFGNDAIGIRRRGLLALGYDHRLVNGADGDRFLARVKELVEAPAEQS